MLSLRGSRRRRRGRLVVLADSGEGLVDDVDVLGGHLERVLVLEQVGQLLVGIDAGHRLLLGAELLPQ